MASRSAPGEGRIILRGDGRYQTKVRYTDQDGGHKRATITGRTIREVSDKRRALVKRVRSGQPATDSRGTLDAAAKRWATTTLEVSDRRPNTKALYRAQLRNHVIGSRLGGTQLRKITPSTIEQWIAGLKSAGLSPSTIRTNYNVLTLVLDTAVRDRVIAENPASKVRPPSVPRPEAPVLDAGQVRAVLAAADGTRSRPVLELLANTGMRIGEALALKWRDVDLDAGTATVRGTLVRDNGRWTIGEPKTAKSRRTIPLTPRAVQVLTDVRSQQRRERLKAGDQWKATGLVFTTELGGARNPPTVRRELRSAVAKAGSAGMELPDGITPHTLRHSTVSVLLDAGIPLKIVSVIVGHSSVSITGDTYAHAYDQGVRRAMETLGELLG